MSGSKANNPMTAKISESTFAYAGISGEARSGQTLGTVNVGLKVQF